MIDTHTHIYEPEFDEDRAEAVLRAREAGVEKLLLPNINEESIHRMMSMVREYPDYCYPMMGLHPEDVKEDWVQILDRMESLISNPSSLNSNPFIAIGEVGLDFYWDDTFKKEQIETFERQICWSRDLELPLMIHVRKAESELLEAMERHKGEGLRGVFHCFSGSKETAQRLLKYEGFCLGIGGVLTFKKSHLPEVLATIPMDRIVLETDSPYLAPVPHRGTRNEPSFVTCIMDRIAEVYETTPKVVSMVTNDNVKRIFGPL